MKELSIHDVVVKLIGPVKPTGDHGVDMKRLKNLGELAALVDLLLTDIENVAVSKDRPESSMATLGRTAQEFLDEVGGSHG